MYSAILQASTAHVRQHPWPVVWLILAITAAAAGLTAVLILNNAAHQDYQQQSSHIPVLTDFEIAGTISSTEPLSIEQHKAFYSTARTAGLPEVIAFQRLNMRLTLNSDTHDVTIYAIDAAALASLAGEAKPDPLGLLGAIAVSHDIAKGLIEDSGLLLEANEQALGLPWVALPERQNMRSTILLDLHALAQLNVSLQPSYLVFTTNSADDITNYLIEHPFQFTPVVATDSPIAITRSFHMSLLAMSLVMFLVCFFIVVNALNLFIAGRLRMLKILRQLGVSRQTIVHLLQFELSLYAIAGALMGIILGQFTAYLLAPSVATTLNNLFGVPVSLGELFHLPIYVPIIAICLITTLVSAILPMKRLTSQLSQIAPMPMPGETSLKAKIYSMLLASIALCGIVFAAHLITVFGTIAALLLSGVASLFWWYPAILSLLVKISKRTGPLVHWTFSHSKVIATHSKLASAAFFIALATHIGMTTMVDSFRTATKGWLQHRLIAAHYYYGDKATLFSLQQKLIQDGIRTQERYQMDLHWQHGEAGFAAQTYSYPSTADYMQGLQVERISPDGISEFSSHRGVFVNQQLAYRQGLDLGDILMVEVADTRIGLAIVGIHYDFGNPDAQVLLPLDLLLQTAWTNEQVATQTVSVVAIHSHDIIALQQHLGELGLPADRLYSRERLLEISLAAFDQTFVITDALNFVTLLVAVFSLITSILLITNQTQYVSGILRSIGVTRAQLILSLLCQYLVIALLTAICALPFGVALAYVLVNKVNLVAFQWLFPLTIDGPAMLIAMGSSLAIIIILSCVPILLNQSRSLREQIQCRE